MRLPVTCQASALEVLIEIALGFALQDGGAVRSLAAEAVYTHAGMLLHADALDQAAELLHAERTKAAPDSTDDSVGSVHALRAALAEFAVHDADEDGVLDADEWRELVQVAARRRRTPCASQSVSQSVSQSDTRCCRGKADAVRSAHQRPARA
jgi:hypothetical protein